MWRWVVSAGVKHWIDYAMWWGEWSPLGGRRAPKKDSRLYAADCSSRWLKRRSMWHAIQSRRPSSTSTRTQAAEFPPECRDSDYEKRLKAAYPIHPEIFDRLYTDWSTLVKFQRTRGVLRLMAAVIHSLWEKGDRNPLISALEHSDRRPARAVRTDALSVGQLGAGDREGCGWSQRAAASARWRSARTLESTRPAAVWRARSTWAPHRPPRQRTVVSKIAASSLDA